MTEKTFGNFELHVEFNVPYMPDAHGQARGNSGVYLTGNYELQVLDSYGLKIQDNDCGAIYHQINPAVNACKPPLQWQTYDVTFHKAKLEDGKVVKKARVTVIQNGIKIIDDAEISPSPGGRELPKARTARSCSRTTAIRFSTGISGSSRSIEPNREVDAAVETDRNVVHAHAERLYRPGAIGSGKPFQSRATPCSSPRRKA